MKHRKRQKRQVTPKKHMSSNDILSENIDFIYVYIKL